jgi:hypothetical protein
MTIPCNTTSVMVRPGFDVLNDRLVIRAWPAQDVCRVAEFNVSLCASGSWPASVLDGKIVVKLARMKTLGLLQVRLGARAICIFSVLNFFFRVSR